MAYHRKSYSLTDISANSNSIEGILYSSTSRGHFVSASEISNSKVVAVKRNPFLGFFYTFAASINFMLASIMVKKLSYIDIGELSLIRNVGVFVGSLPVVVYCTDEVLGAKKDRRLLLTRGFIGATALYLNLTAYRYLPLAEAAIILSTAPALTTLIAHFYLKEPCGFTQIFSLILTISGVLTSVRLPELLSKRNSTRFDIYYLAGLASGIGCVLTLSVTFVAIRKMKDIHFSLPMMYLGLLGMIENGLINAITSTFETPFCGWDLAMYILIGSLGFFSNCAFTLSIQVQSAGIVSVLKASMDIIIAILFQIIFFNESPDFYSICGACLVIASVSMIGIRNWLLMLPEESKTRKKLKYFLF